MRDWIISHVDSRTGKSVALVIWNEHLPLYAEYQDRLFVHADGHLYVAAKNRWKFCELLMGKKPKVGFKLNRRCRNGDKLDLRGCNWAWCSYTEFQYHLRMGAHPYLEPGISKPDPMRDRYKITFTPPGGKTFTRRGLTLREARRQLHYQRARAGIGHLNEEFLNPDFYHTEEGNFSGEITSVRDERGLVRIWFRVLESGLSIPWDWRSSYRKTGPKILSRCLGKNISLDDVRDGKVVGERIAFSVHREGNFFNTSNHKRIKCSVGAAVT